MVSTLIIVVCASLLFSFFTSLSEAALYAVPLATTRSLARQGVPGGKALDRLKSDMPRVISAILILNIIGTTAGAAIAGSQAGELWPETGVVVFSIFFTLIILVGGELIPKTLGVTHARRVALIIAPTWIFLVRVMGPFVKLATFVSRLFGPSGSDARVSQEEILSLVNLGATEGTIDEFEGNVIQNVIEIDDTLVRDILTPRTTVFMLPESATIGEVKDQIFKWQYSRIPIYLPSDPDHLTGYVMHRDIVKELLNGETKTVLRKLARPIKVLPELSSVRQVLSSMFKENEHICSLVDEHGSLAGIVTLEDILEELVGTEIEDESDQS